MLILTPGWKKTFMTAIPKNARDRNIDILKDVRGGTENRERSKNQNQDSQHYERVRPFQCDSNNPHNSRPIFLFRPVQPDCFAPVVFFPQALGKAIPMPHPGTIEILRKYLIREALTLGGRRPRVKAKLRRVQRTEWVSAR